MDRRFDPLTEEKLGEWAYRVEDCGGFLHVDHEPLSKLCPGGRVGRASSFT